MPFLVLHVVLAFLLDLAHVLTRSDHDRALELLLLRQQLRLYERQATQPRPSRGENARLASPATLLRSYRSMPWPRLCWLVCSSARFLGVHVGI